MEILKNDISYSEHALVIHSSQISQNVWYTFLVGPYILLVHRLWVHSSKQAPSKVISTHYDQDGYPSRRGQENQKRFGNCLFQQAPVQCSALCWAIRRSILWSWYKLSALELKSISWGQSANFFTTIIPFRLVNGSPAPVISRSVIICLLLDYIPLAASFTLKKIDALMECKVYWYLSFLF